jgi:hypothetical protein
VRGDALVHGGREDLAVDGERGAAGNACLIGGPSTTSRAPASPALRRPCAFDVSVLLKVFEQTSSASRSVLWAGVAAPVASRTRRRRGRVRRAATRLRCREASADDVAGHVVSIAGAERRRVFGRDGEDGPDRI